MLFRSENTYHFTNEWAGMSVKLGKLERYFGKLEIAEVKLSVLGVNAKDLVLNKRC